MRDQVAVRATNHETFAWEPVNSPTLSPKVEWELNPNANKMRTEQEVSFLEWRNPSARIDSELDGYAVFTADYVGRRWTPSHGTRLIALGSDGDKDYFLLINRRGDKLVLVKDHSGLSVAVATRIPSKIFTALIWL